MKIIQPLKWWGGKHYLAKDFIALMPRHLHYVEPYAGGLAVLLEKDPFDPSKFWGSKCYEQGVSEVVNDINRELTNFWQVLQREDAFAAFRRRIEATPFSQVEWGNAKARQHPVTEMDVEAAVAFFVRCRQSRAGGFRDFATLSRNRTRGKKNEQVSAWLTCVEGLPAVSPDCGEWWYSTNPPSKSSVNRMDKRRCSTWIPRICMRPVLPPALTSTKWAKKTTGNCLPLSGNAKARSCCRATRIRCTTKR